VNDDAFARLIAEDVKNNISAAQKEYLQMPSNLNRWHRGLIALNRNLEEQIQSIAKDEEADIVRYINLGKDGEFLLSQAMSHYSEKKSKITRFKFHVEKRLNEVLIKIDSGNDGENSYSDFLKLSILKHKELIEKLELEPTDIDKALWASVDGLWLFDDVLESKTDKLYAP
jgi:hypothetical protein